MVPREGCGYGFRARPRRGGRRPESGRRGSLELRARREDSESLRVRFQGLKLRGEKTVNTGTEDHFGNQTFFGKPRTGLLPKTLALRPRIAPGVPFRCLQSSQPTLSPKRHFYQRRVFYHRPSPMSTLIFPPFLRHFSSPVRAAHRPRSRLLGPPSRARFLQRLTRREASNRILDGYS
jgi:hypothetical protein